MRDLVLKIILWATLLVCTSGALAQEWNATSGTNPQGLQAASMFVQQNEFAMEFYCDERDWEDGRLGVKFFGPALPRLYGEDGDTTKLSLLFTLRDGVLYREIWDAYYFDGGLGDQAWLGNINAGKSEFNALARALKLEILNQDGELVYSFGTRGTAAGVAIIRDTCKFERDEIATEPEDTKAPAQTPVSGPPKPTDQLSYKEWANALTIEQFKLKMGWPEKIASFAISTPPEMKFAIIDSGFAGIEKYVTDTPKLHGRVRLYSLGDQEKQSGDHGLHVLKVVNEVMPAGQIYLINAGGAGGKDLAVAAVKKMNELGVHYGTMSLGTLGLYGRHNFGPEVPEFVQLLESTQTTLFVSSGNYRHETHSVAFSDANQNGFLEVWPDGANVSDLETLKVKKSGDRRGQLVFAWDVPQSPDGEVVIYVSDGESFNLTERYPVKDGVARVPIETDSVLELAIRIGVEGVSQPFGGIKVRKIGLDPAGAPWNGLHSNGDYAIWDSPFLIPVGAAGERDGRLIPSDFSSIDKSNTGGTMPLILGPGQVHIGDETFDGTSYSTPFIAALYAPFGSQNISNVIEQTSDFSAFGEGFSSAELGRWGMPSARKVLGSNLCTVKNNQINAIELSGTELNVELQFSRNCMEKLEYAVVMGLETIEADPTTGRVGNVTNTIGGVEQSLTAMQKDKSEQRDIVDKKMSFSLDLANLSPRFKGVKVRPKFYIFTRLAPSGHVLFAPSDDVLELS